MAEPIDTLGENSKDNGIRPDLSELIALRDRVLRRKPARRGRLGVSGPSLSPLRGRGMEYAESREYQWGDDARHMDWRLTARTGKAHSKVFQAERERLTLLVADTSPRLYFGTRVCFKSVQAARIGAIAAWQAIKDGDRVAALRGSRTEEPVRPATGLRGALKVVHALMRWYNEPPPDDGGLSMAIRHAIRVAKPGTRIVLLADPVSIATIEPAQWSALSQHKELIVMLLSDPLETDEPYADVHMRGPNGAHQIDLTAPAVRDAWQAALAQPLYDAKQMLASKGLRVVAVSTTDPPDAWLDLLSIPQARVA